MFESNRPPRSLGVSCRLLSCGDACLLRPHNGNEEHLAFASQSLKRNAFEKIREGGREGCWMLLTEKFRLGSSQTSREWFPFLVYHFAKRMRGTYGWKASHSSSLELKWLERGTPNVFFFFFHAALLNSCPSADACLFWSSERKCPQRGERVQRLGLHISVGIQLSSRKE